MSEDGQPEGNSQPISVPGVTAPIPDETVVVEAPAPATLPFPDRHNETDDAFKAVFRDHARWAMIEMQLCAEGKTMDERAALNP